MNQLKHIDIRKRTSGYIDLFENTEDFGEKIKNFIYLPNSMIVTAEYNYKNNSITIFLMSSKFQKMCSVTKISPTEPDKLPLIFDKKTQILSVSSEDLSFIWFFRVNGYNQLILIKEKEKETQQEEWVSFEEILHIRNFKNGKNIEMCECLGIGRKDLYKITSDKCLKF